MPRLAPHEPDQFHGEVFLVLRPIPGERRGFTGCGKTRLCRHSVRSFGVRQLAAALARASLLAGSDALGCNPRERARGEESGSKLPHSKASLRMTAETSFSAACKTPPFRNVVRNPDWRPMSSFTNPANCGGIVLGVISQWSRSRERKPRKEFTQKSRRCLRDFGLRFWATIVLDTDKIRG